VTPGGHHGPSFSLILFLFSLICLSASSGELTAFIRHTTNQLCSFHVFFFFLCLSHTFEIPVRVFVALHLSFWSKASGAHNSTGFCSRTFCPDPVYLPPSPHTFFSSSIDPTWFSVPRLTHPVSLHLRLKRLCDFWRTLLSPLNICAPDFLRPSVGVLLRDLSCPPR